MGVSRNAERMRMYYFGIRKLMAVIEKIRGRKKECIHEHEDDSGIFSKRHHSRAKLRKKRKGSNIFIKLAV